MAEKASPKKRPTAPARQQMLEALSETEKQVAQRKEGAVRPEEKIEAKASREAVAVAEVLSTDGVVKSISDLRGTVGKTLAQLSDRLEEEVAKYVQIQRAIAAKTEELKEIYEIQKSASTLTALIEAQQRKRDELETEYARDKESLEREIEELREQWEAERKQHDAAIKERDVAEKRRREREEEEYRYAFNREQQLAKNQFADEQAAADKALAERKAQVERELQERERAVAAAEQELKSLRQRVESFPKELETAAARAAAEAGKRIQQEAAASLELAKREFTGERNVLTTRIAALEQTVKEQAEQLGKLSQQSERAYGQMQEIAVRAIEGSSGAKSLANLQQLLTEQARKPAER